MGIRFLDHPVYRLHRIALATFGPEEHIHVLEQLQSYCSNSNCFLSRFIIVLFSVVCAEKSHHFHFFTNLQEAKCTYTLYLNKTFPFLYFE